MESDAKKIIVQSSISIVLESQVNRIPCNGHNFKIRTQSKSEMKVVRSQTVSSKAK